ncbi:hypothetical protein [Pseudomonas fontis]|uniref:Lipoprotein n=1 Tax=Pseudomonas fontis TaxID=2942633 RepID=A0ABT5NUC9_9PSED|nr:hypothetical protein [Pseudomonas fontis]MDD0973944.1 hypothetical protein [Pseudomonas fontis]MDD0991786.1 hypothetical protein [Pseudomonas fontis]
MELQTPFRNIALFTLLAATLAGCQTNKPNEASLKNRAEITLGEPISRVSNVRSDNSTTYFTASAASGEYSCESPSGPMFAFASMGIIDPGAFCSEKGKGSPSMLPFKR